MTTEEERELLEHVARIHRRIQWVGNTMIGVMCIAIYEFISKSAAAKSAWNLSDDAATFIGVAVAVIAGALFGRSFNRK